MLSEKAWRPDAVVRLILSVFVCIFAGSLVMSGVHYLTVGGKVISWFSALAVASMVCLMGTLVLANRPWVLETFVRRVVIVLSLFYSGLLLGAWAQKLGGPAGHSVWQMLVGTLSFQGAALLLVWRFLREHQAGWREAFGLRNAWVHACLFGVIAACVFLPVGRTLQWLSMLAMEHAPQLPIKPQEQEAVQTLRVAATWVDRVTMGVITIVLAPVGEEVLFRGILYPWIKQAGFPKLALWITSAVFAAVHLNMAIFLPLFVLAMVLAVLYEYTDNLLAPITTHSLFNALNFAMLYLLERG